MIAVIVMLAVLAAVLGVICLLQRYELYSVEKQLKELSTENTNNLLRSSTGTADRLITEINRLLKEMRKVRVEHTRKSHAMEQMMTNISHDLRTPLTSALGYIDLIRNADISEEEKKRELEVIEQRLMRLEELINSFFEFSKIISGGKIPEKEVLDPVGILEESIVHYFDDYESRGRCISLYCPQRRLKISSNRSMLLRIFDNLVGNALKHGSGELKVSIVQEDVLRVTFENPAEINELDIEHIFDEFYTTDISRTKGGTGLGLAIAKQFTEMLGGRIEAKAEDSVFTVLLEFNV